MDLLQLQVILIALCVTIPPVWNSLCPTDDCICYKDKEIGCSEMNLKHIPRFYEDDHVYSMIDLGKNKIRNLKPRAFRHLKVKRVRIWRNAVDMSVQPNAFSGLDNHVEIIDLRRSHVSNLPVAVFRKMKKLSFVELSANKISTLRRGVFRGANSVKELNLMNNDLTTLDPGAFYGLRNLTTLKLGVNKITLINARAFHGLGLLEELYLEGNRIRDLQPRTFHGLVNLRKLDLSNNQIPALFPLMLYGLPALEYFSASRNPLLLLADNCFAGMPGLKELELARGQLSYLRAKMFRGMTSLRDLYLQYNELTEIPTGLFRHAPNLKKVQLENNQLRTLSPCAFDDVRKMEEIWLYGNPIQCGCARKETRSAKLRRAERRKKTMKSGGGPSMNDIMIPEPEVKEKFRVGTQVECCSMQWASYDTYNYRVIGECRPDVSGNNILNEEISLKKHYEGCKAIKPTCGGSKERRKLFRF